MMYIRCTMLILLRFASRCRSRQLKPKGTTAFLSTLSSTSTIHHSSALESHHFEDRRYANSGSSIRHPVDAAYFPIFYNDVFEVDLPTGHRFPMGKYRKVREAVQTKVDSLAEEERGRIHCGKFLRNTGGPRISASYDAISSIIVPY